MHPLGKINSAFVKALGLVDEKKYTPHFINRVTLKCEDIIPNCLRFI